MTSLSVRYTLLFSVSISSIVSIGFGGHALAACGLSSPGVGGSGGYQFFNMPRGGSGGCVGASGEQGFDADFFGGGGGGGGGAGEGAGGGGGSNASGSPHAGPGQDGALSDAGSGGGGGGGNGGAHGRQASGSVTIDQAVSGLAGGKGGNGGMTVASGGNGGTGGGGGAGGFGLMVNGAGTVVISSTIKGGLGGNGGNGGNAYGGNSGSGGMGGAGGVGVYFSDQNGRLSNRGTIQGGDGGKGGARGHGTDDTFDLSVEAPGGFGGAGVWGNILAVTNESTGKIIGGDGGGDNGAEGARSKVWIADGGGGISGSGSHVQNSGLISGGKGADSQLGQGGNGGGGVAGSGLVIVNSGHITGGGGGNGGKWAQNNSGGVGGDAIQGKDISIVNSGSLTKGLGGQAGTETPPGGSEPQNGADGAAVRFTGGTNSIELQAGFQIGGDVLAYSAADTLLLGGDSNASFNMATIGTATSTNAQYKGFGHFEKTGASVWTLTGATQASTPWMIRGGTLQIGDGQSSGWTTGDITVATGGIVAFNRADTVTFSDAISGSGTLLQKGTGTTILTGTNTYSGGTTISAGTLQIGNGGATGTLGSGAIVNNAALVADRTGTLTIAGTITGTGSFMQKGAGITVLAGENGYSGGTTVSGGKLQISSDGNLGAVSGGLTMDGGTLVNAAAFASGRNITFSAQGGSIQTDLGLTLTGAFDASHAADGWHKTGAGELVFDAAATGALGSRSQIDAGKVAINGHLAGDFYVNGGGTLAVNGIQDGDVHVQWDGRAMGYGTVNTIQVAEGGALLGHDGQTLTVKGDLHLQAGSQLDLTLGAPNRNGPLYNVMGNLDLNGTLNITDAGGFGAGTYHLVHYGGTLNSNTMGVGSVPSGADGHRMSIDASKDHDVYLMNSSGVVLDIWHGGSGTWNLATDHSNDVWTDIEGTIDGPYDNGSYAVFMGNGGTVRIDNSQGAVKASGINFATHGYVLTGGPLLLDAETQPIIRVGDGQIAHADITATIAAELQGTKGISKTDYGTLILTGENTYTGGTTVTGGVLQLGDGGASGSIQGNIDLASNAYGHGTLAFDRRDTATFAGDISGVGNVIQKGEGTTIFAGNNTYSGGLTVERGIARAASADHAFGAGRVTVKSGASLDLANLNETIGGLAGGAAGDGNIELGSGTLTLNQSFDSQFSGTVSGTGGLTKKEAGRLTLYGANIYEGSTAVEAGSLIQGAQGAFSASSAFFVANGATIDLGGFSSGMAALSNAGTVNFGGSGGTTLTVAGDYSGRGGMLVINTVLGADNSITDLVKVGGNTSGTTTLSVNNRGGLGAQTVNGIKVIDVAGQSDGAFSLQGDYVTKDGKSAIMTSSAYAYTLQRGSGVDAGNWYLASQNTKAGPVAPSCEETGTCPPPRYSAAAPAYESYTATLQALNRLPTLQQRVGNRYQGMKDAIREATGLSGETDSRAIWGRIEGAHGRLENGSMAGNLHQDINTLIMQAGVDGQFYENGDGKLIAGITGQYGNARSSVSSFFGDGSIDAQGWGLGATATWYGNDGFYLDGQAQANWYDSDLGIDAANPTLKDGSRGFGYALSLEAGQRFEIDEHWSLTPQAQLMFSSVDFNSFTDSYGARISNSDGDSLMARLGLAAGYANGWKGEDNRMINTSVYGIANLYQEFLGGTRINYSGTLLGADRDRTWAGIGAGGTYAWADSKYALYGEGSLNTSLNHFADSYALKGTVGFKVRW